MDDAIGLPSLERELRALRQRLSAVERTPRFAPVAAPSVVVGAVEDAGFASVDSTSMATVIRSDVAASAPVLSFEVATSTAYGAGGLVVGWQVVATDYTTGTSYTVAGSADTSGMTVSTVGAVTSYVGAVDLFDEMGGEATFGRFVRLDLQVMRTGGSGSAAGRLSRPLLLRVQDLA